MARLTYEDYLRHLSVESARFRDVVEACDPAARVPSCPEWDASDLLWHQAEGQDYWATIVLNRPAGPEGLTDPERPEAYDDLLAFFDEQSARFLTALRDAAPDEEAWSWSPDRTVGFTARRQAHEALIHRLDAEEAAGKVTALDPALASDGVEEVLEVMYGGCPPWGTFTLDGTGLVVQMTDTGQEVLVALGRFTGTHPDDGTAYDVEDIHVVSALDSPGATVSGTANDLDTWLWRRGAGVDERINVEGDRATYDRFRACVNHPINN